MNDAQLFQWARTTMRQALSLDWPNLVVTPQAEYWLLGQVYGESRFGTTPDWGTSNNWGAVTYHLKDGKFIEHADHAADGTPVVYRFQAYDTQLDAARDWLRVLLRRGVPLALAGTDPKTLAAAMYQNGYYTGVSGTDLDRIAAYTMLIVRGATLAEERLAVADGAPDYTDVRKLQEKLTELGYMPGPVDGIMGPKTEAAVKMFQGANSLAVDGVAGPRTRLALIRA